MCVALRPLVSDGRVAPKTIVNRSEYLVFVRGQGFDETRGHEVVKATSRGFLFCVVQIPIILALVPFTLPVGCIRGRGIVGELVMGNRNYLDIATGGAVIASGRQR